MKNVAVIALGGNALGKTPESQLELVKNTAKVIVKLFLRGTKIIVTHGNGPQIGMINSAMEYSATHGGNTSYMPFPECGAMSQGYIGYHLQQSIQAELHSQKICKLCITIVTQVQVDPNDDGFCNPTKPIGCFYDAKEAEMLEKIKGYTFIDDAGRGYRRVVSSPKPKRILELEAIKQLAENGDIVIAAGGGGVPVIEDNGEIKGVAAVIDKDRTAALLANELHADRLMILTAVDNVCINFNLPNQKALRHLSVQEAKQYIQKKEFAQGSMLPKVEACIDFVNNNPNRRATIASLEHAEEAFDGRAGTEITFE